jgi:dTDP-4-dehydrorhamnose 3,5-epimerase
MTSSAPEPPIAGVVVRDLVVHRDERGSFVETFRREWVPGGREMLQGNRADRQAGSLVGLHFHRHQADWWYVVAGSARVVLHDLRVGSPSEATTMAFDLSADAPAGVFIPAGVAHGFAALTDVTLTYLVDGYYDPADELGVAWDDPDIDADWGVAAPVLSARDGALPRRTAIELPVFPA